jgi:hypothetical protein
VLREKDCTIGVAKISAKNKFLPIKLFGEQGCTPGIQGKAGGLDRAAAVSGYRDLLDCSFGRVKVVGIYGKEAALRVFPK